MVKTSKRQTEMSYQQARDSRTLFSRWRVASSLTLEGTFLVYYGNSSTSLATYLQFSSVQSLSRVWLSATPWTAARQAFLSHHQLPEFTQTCVHWVSDAIQSSHPLSSPSPPAPNPSQHRGLFQWVNSSHQVAKVLEFQPQHQSFQWKPRTYNTL